MAYGSVNVAGSSSENTDELKTILNDLKDNVGSTADSGGSVTEGTVNGKLNKVIEDAEDTKTSIKEMQTVDIPSIKGNLTSIKEDNKTNTTTIINNTAGLKMDIMNLNKQMLGEASPYGTGSWGDVEYDPESFHWVTKDYYGRYVIQCTSLHIPSGVTMTPPDKCNGLYILCQGDITIDGTIDLRDKRLDSAGAFSLQPSIIVNGKEYILAKGGDTVVGGAGGDGGGYSENGVANPSYNTSITAGKGGTPTKTICGSVVGGGISSYGTGGTGIGYRSSGGDSSGTAGIEQTGTIASGAVVIISKGKVTLNGKIISSASDGITATQGEDAYMYRDEDSPSANGGKGGNGAIAPSGGGCVTIIANSFVNNGIIDTKGKTFTSANGENGKYKSWDRYPYYGYLGGYGGKGGTFTSCAGEIRVYETGGNE